MSNTGEFYDHTTYPVTRSTASSSGMRQELDLVEAGFNKLPPMSGNALRLVKVGAAGTDMTVTSIYEDASSRVLVGTSSSRSVFGAGRGLQMESTGALGSISLTRNSNDASGAVLALVKTRGITVGSNTIVQNGDGLGQIVFVGADGTDTETPGASIQAVIDGMPGANDMPTALDFYTTADGSASASLRVRVNNQGAVSIGTSAVLGSEKLRVIGDIQLDNANYFKSRLNAGTATRLFGINASDILYIGSIDAAHSSTLFVSGGATLATLTSGGNLGIGMTPAQVLDITKSQNTISSIQILNSDAGASASARVVATNGATQIGLIMNGTGHSSANVGQLFVSGSNPFAVLTNGQERVRVDAVGLGIGAAPAARPLEVHNATRSIARVQATQTTGTDAISGFEFHSWDGASVALGASLYHVYSLQSTEPNSVQLNVVRNAVFILKTNNADSMRVDGSGVLTLVKSTSAIGYGTGAGGTVTQLTSKATGVTLNRPSGQITMNGAALAAATAVSFTLTNSVISTTDVVHACIDGGATAGAYSVTVDAVGAGTCQISLRNHTAGSLSEAVVLNFVVLRAATA